MKLYCRYKEMRFGDARFPNGLVIKNYTTTLDDEIASLLALEHPSIFSVRRFAKADQINSVYEESTDPPPVDSTDDIEDE